MKKIHDNTTNDNVTVTLFNINQNDGAIRIRHYYKGEFVKKIHNNTTNNNVTILEPSSGQHQ